MNRREFIRTTVSAAAFTIVPSHVLGGSGHVPPSDKLKLAYIGCGTQGIREMSDLIANQDIQIVSVCDPNKFTTNYVDFRELLEKEKDIDVVKVMTPDHLHAAISIAAAKKKKRVVMHKPIANRMHEARLTLDTVRYELLKLNKPINHLLYEATYSRNYPERSYRADGYKSALDALHTRDHQTGWGESKLN